MGSSGHGTPTPGGRDVEPRGAVDVPAVSSSAPVSKIEKNWVRYWLDKVTDFLNIFDPPRDVRPSVWCQPACGFVLTLMYLVGVIFIIVIYTTFSHDGRPLVVRIEYVSPAKILDDSLEDFFCACDLPAEVQSYRNDDSKTQERRERRRQHLHRCYSEDELEDIDVLQFGDDTDVGQIISNTKSGKTPEKKNFTSQNTVRWKSYELTSRNGDLFELHPDPITRLSVKLKEHGYVGTDGILDLKALAELPFFTVPQGFIRADVNYNCSSCTACRELWAKYGASQAAPELNSFSWEQDGGWTFCYQTSGDPVNNDEVCRGACRFFPTVYRPWGIAMNNFSIELLSYIPENDSTTVYFRSRLFYAFEEEFSGTANETYELRFIEIKRSDVLWTEITRWYSDIPSCEDSNTYCNGTYICQAAAIYDPDEINSEKIKAKCLPEATHESDESWTWADCNKAKESLELEFRDKNDTRLARLCEPFKCLRLQPSQVTWNKNELVGGEIALSRLMYTPSVISRYRPSLCTNTHQQVFVKRNESESKELLSIYSMTCNNRTGRTNRTETAKVCWMTGGYKTVTDTSLDGWKNHTFTDDEKAAEEEMFSCYRFDKESYPKYMYDQFGVVSGNIGSWLLVLSCIFWVITKTNMPARVESRWVPLGHSETSDSSQTEMSEIVTRPDETQGQNDEDDNTSEQNPTKQKTSYQRLPK